MNRIKLLAMALVFGAAGVLAPNGNVSASPSMVLDSVAPWVEVVRYIPVYVDGKLAGYIASVEWVYVVEESPIES
jgi:hypothetical protein